MAIIKKNLLNLFYLFLILHLVLWTVVPSIVNKNLPLDVIEALAWGSNLDWGFNKHPPGSAFFPEVFFRIFGPQDWSYYFLSQIFVITSFYFVFKLSYEFLNDLRLSIISVVLLESIFFYNFTTPEFNVNVSQLPFWAISVYLTWQIFKTENPRIVDLIFLGIVAAVGFLCKYLFLYLLISLALFFIYFIFIIQKKQFKFIYLISIEVFLVLLVPHFIWLSNNEFITITYGLGRTGLEGNTVIDHFKNPFMLLIKQVVILIPFFLLCFTLNNKLRLNINFNDKKIIFLIFINFIPLILILFTSLVTGSKIRTMWMTPFYLYIGLIIVYLYKSKINFKKINYFIICFIFLFFLSPFLYAYVSISNDDKRTDYPGKQIANKVQLEWDKNFDEPIGFVIGDEWNAGNLSYHLKSRPKWEGFINNNNILNEAKEYICIDDICVGTYK